MRLNRRAASKRLVSLSALSLFLLGMSGCRGCNQVQQPSAPAPSAATAEQPAEGEDASSEPAAKEPAAKYIYIDSLPRGAQVSLTDDTPGSKDEALGATPLRIEPGKLSGKKVVVTMSIAELIRKMKTVPDLSEETTHLQLQEEFGESEADDDFAFFDTPTSRLTKTADGALVEVGPEYEIHFPDTNRVCAYFIPRGVSASKFYPLMPPEGTFLDPKENWAERFVARYRLSPDQAREAAETLSRAGRYQTVVPSQTTPGYGEKIVLVVEGEPPAMDLHVSRWVGQVYKGIDY